MPSLGFPTLNLNKPELAGYPNPTSVSANEINEAIGYAPLLKDYYLSNYNDNVGEIPSNTWAHREALVIKASLNNPMVRMIVAGNELPALALFYGPPVSKSKWAEALNKSGDFVDWTASSSLVNGVSRALRSKIVSFNEKTSRKAKWNDFVWPTTRLELLQWLQKAFIPSTWRDKLIENIKGQDEILSESDMNTAERRTMSILYKDTVSVMEQKRAEEAFKNLPILPGAAFPGSTVPLPRGPEVVPPIRDTSAGIFDIEKVKKYMSSGEGILNNKVLLLGGGAVVLVGLALLLKR